MRKHPELKTKRIFVGFSSINRKSPDTKLYDIELVKRDLLNHFYTRKGERVMEPEFGTIIWDLLFEPFDELVKERIYSETERIISSDPRVEPLNISVTESEKGIIIRVDMLFKPYDIQESLFVNYYRNEFNEEPVP